MFGVLEKENRVIRRASPLLRHRSDAAEPRPLAAYDTNIMESSKIRPRKTGESSARRLADHSSMSHLQSIYGGRPQKLSGTLSSSKALSASKRVEEYDDYQLDSSKNHGPSSDRGTVAELIRRFRMAPPAPREERNSVDYWWRGGSDGKASDTSGEILPAEVEPRPSRRRAASANSLHRDAAPALSVIQKRPLSAHSMASAESLKVPHPFRDAPKSAYEYDAEIDQRLKGAEHLLSDWKLKKKSSSSSSMMNYDAKRQISATVSILKRKYGIPTTSESSDTCISDSESIAEPKKHYPHRLRMIVTGDVAASPSLDDAPMQETDQNLGFVERLSVDSTSKQSTACDERVQPATSSSHVVSDSLALLVPIAIAPAATANMDSDDRDNMKITSDWIEMDQCVYPAGAPRQTNYRPLDSWLASCEQDCFLSSWVHSSPTDDGPASGEGPELLGEELDDPIAQMLKVREKALLAALSALDTD